MNFTPEDRTRLAATIRESEGLRLAAYRCPAGALTVGYGHNCDASPLPGVRREGDRISQAQAESLLCADLDRAIAQVSGALPWLDRLAPARQAVLVDMAFNMGLGIPGSCGLLSFTNTLRHMELGEYAAAAAGMLASKWARQVKGRAIRLSRQMESGQWQA